MDELLRQAGIEDEIHIYLTREGYDTHGKDALVQLLNYAYERAAMVAEAQAGGHYMAKICAAAIRALKGE